MISLNIEKTFGFISKESVFAYEAQVKAAQGALENGTGKGNDFLGWLHLPSSISKEHLADLKATAEVLRDNCEVVVVAGIGGSYLGARAVIEALSNSFAWLQEKKSAPTILYAGHNIGEDYLYELTEYLEGKKFGVINISKSGTTTETALAFRLLKKQCEDIFGEGYGNPSVEEFNKRYGGLDQNGTRVFFSTGSQDPWTWTCVTEDSGVKEGQAAHTIAGLEIGHCRDLHAPQATDPADLVRVRAYERALFNKWMAEDDV